MGRREPVHDAVVAALHRHGVAGATVLLGVDGTAHGERRRARFLGRNARRAADGHLGGRGGRARRRAAGARRRCSSGRSSRSERVRVCKRDGATLDAPEPAEGDAWQKLMVYATAQARSTRRARAPAARAPARRAPPTLRGVWGYHGDHAPHGDSLWQLRRRVPVRDGDRRHARSAARWCGMLDELTAETGLVTSELVPTVHPRVGA